MHFNSALTATLVLAGTAFAEPAANVEGGSIFARQSDDSPANVIGIPRLRQPPFRVDEKKFPPGSIRPAVCGIGAWSGCKRAADAEAGESSIPEHEPNNDIFDPIKFFNERVKENEAKYGNTPVLDRRSYEVPDGSVGIPDEVKFAPGTIRPAVCGFGYGNCKREAKPEAEDGSILARQSLDGIIQRFRDQEAKGRNVGGGARLAVCGMGQGWSGCKRDAQQKQENAQPELKPETQVERPFGLRQRPGVGGNMVAFPAVCGRWYSSCKRSPQPVAEAQPEPEAEALEIPEGRFKVDESRFPPGTARLAVCGIGAWSGCKREAAPEAIPLPEPLPFEIPEDPSERARLRDDLSRQGFAFPAVCGAWHSTC